MSLESPNLFEKALQHKRWIIYGVLGLVLLGLVLFLYQCGSDYVFKRDIDKRREAVNAALGEANQVAANIAAEKDAANRIAQNVNVATQEYLEASNLTDATRANVNAALERMHKAANNNANVNANELHELLKGL